MFRKIRELAEKNVNILCQFVPSPVEIPFSESFVYRYAEKNIYQAIIQKLARVTSTLNAAVVLMENGFYQEQATLHRVIDEINEDITFLCFGIVKNDITELHKNFLEAFYEEEFDKESSLESTQKRPMISRNKIQAYINYLEEAGSDPSTGKEASRTVFKANSGFVHAASPQIMDIYGGSPPRFHMSGMKGTPREAEYFEEIWNYHYRTLTSFAISAKAFGSNELFEECEKLVIAMEKTAGKNYAYSEGKT